MSDEPKQAPPQHTFEVSIRIGGETWEYVERVINEIAEYVKAHGPDANLISGGAGGCHGVTVMTREISPETYLEELEVWWRSLRAMNPSRQTH